MKLITKILNENQRIIPSLANIINRKLIEEGSEIIMTDSKLQRLLYNWKNGLPISGEFKRLINYAINQFFNTNYGFDKEAGEYELEQEIKI